MEKSADIRNLQTALIVYAIVFAMKLAVYMVSGVMALLAETLHTLSDIFVTGFLLLAAYYSSRKADELHMFGHGRAQNIAALVAATLFISFTSLRLYEEAIPHLLSQEPREYKNLGWVVAILIASMALAAVPLVKLFLQKERGPAARAQYLESINDELGLVAALAGTLFIIARQPVADPIASIIVATIIAYNGIKLFRENFNVLVGSSPGQEYLNQIRKTALSVEGVLDVHELRAETVGQELVHAVMHISVSRGTSLEDANLIAEEVQRRIHQGREGSYCVVHVDAAGQGID